MIVYVLLVYSKEYLRKAIDEMNFLAKTIGVDYKIIIINNNKDLVVEYSIQGDNSAYEFSGWDTALNYIRENINEKLQGVVFANDTFCHHRKWGGFQRLKFSTSFKKMIFRNFSGICGDKNSFMKDFNVLGENMNGWISSYLFFISPDIIFNKDFKFNMIDLYVKDWIIDINEKEGVVFSDHLDESLSIHLNNWLFPSENYGWYRAKNTSIEQKASKLRSILNEKILTANILKLGGYVYDVNNITYFKYYYLLKRVLKKFLKR